MKIIKTLSLEITVEQFLNSCSPLELIEINMLIQNDFYTKRMNAQVCIGCGCTDWNCTRCIEKTGEPCHWAEQDLCSACAESSTKIIKEIQNEV